MRADQEQRGVRTILTLGLRLALSISTWQVTLFSAVIVLTVAPRAQATTYSWQVASGDWSAATNWSAGVLPTGIDWAVIANGGTANVTQRDPTCGTLSVGSSAHKGTLRLTSGSLSITDSEYVGDSGLGTFTQTGGTNTVKNDLHLGNNPGSSGTYNLSGGALASYREFIGPSGSGNFMQTGGTNSTTMLSVGGWSSSSGTYCLSGSGLLLASAEYLSSGTTGIFVQSGGTNSAGSVDFNSGKYVLSGGLLRTNGLTTGGGTLDGSGGSGHIVANSSLVDLSGTFVHTSSTTLTVDANSLVVVPANFNPASVFNGYSNLGLTHTRGTTLTIAAGKGFGGAGIIFDPVVCYGTISAVKNGQILLLSGLTISGTGTVDLGIGSLGVNDRLSEIGDNGQLNGYEIDVGNGGTGTFTQTGGTVGGKSTPVVVVGVQSGNAGTYNQSGGISSLSQLYLGQWNGSSGTYNLSGSARLAATYYEIIGSSGTGTFTQSGGTNCPSTLYLAYYPDSEGVYNFGGGSLASAISETIGNSGKGSFSQSGGTNTISESLYLGFAATGSGAYSLSGDSQLTTNYEDVGCSGSGVFTQSGGIHVVSWGLVVGEDTGSSGCYSLAGSSQLISFYETIGASGNGLFTQSDGVNCFSSGISIGSVAAN